jgi:hypothetical protein
MNLRRAAQGALEEAATETKGHDMAQRMTKEEAQAISSYEAEQAAKQEAERRANRSLEDIYLDAFESYTDTAPETTPHIMEALAVMGRFFAEDRQPFPICGTV